MQFERVLLHFRVRSRTCVDDVQHQSAAHVQGFAERLACDSTLRRADLALRLSLARFISESTTARRFVEAVPT